MTSLTALLVALFLKPAAVLAAAAVVTACLRGHSAAARHAVWSGAIIATLALPVLSGTLPPLRVRPIADAIGRSLPGVTRSGTTVSPGADTGSPSAPTRVLPRTGTSNGPRLGVTGTASRLPEALVAVWILGAVLLGTRRIIAEVRARRILHCARPATNPRLARLITDVTGSSGVRGPVELRLSDETAAPAVAGILRPVVLLPTAAETWTEADVVAVLFHEVGHVARRDCLVNLLADVATTIYWCNPILRVAVRRLRAESERACDDRVLHGGAEPEGYAHLLLRVARKTRVPGALSDVAIAMAGPRELESRLLAVLDSRVSRNPLPRWMPVALASLGVFIALPIAALTLRAAPLTAQVMAPEPDRLADSLARPASERLTLAPDAYRLSPGATRALAGPDSVLARRLATALAHVPSHDADLIRERAAWALSQARDGQLVEPLIEALDARDWRVQSYAAWALATARDPRAITRLVSLLDHPIWRLRAMAAYAVREAGDPQAETAMTTALTDPAWQVRLEAVEYFVALGGPTLVGRIRPRLDDRHIAVRLAAQRALTR